jgi:hypothetical protein
VTQREVSGAKRHDCANDSGCRPVNNFICPHGVIEDPTILCDRRPVTSLVRDKKEAPGESQGSYREKSAIQFGSQVFPPSGIYLLLRGDLSHRCKNPDLDKDAMPNQGATCSDPATGHRNQTAFAIARMIA